MKISKKLFQKRIFAECFIVILVIFENYVSHGSVSTQLRCGGIFYNYFIVQQLLLLSISLIMLVRCLKRTAMSGA